MDFSSFNYSIYQTEHILDYFFRDTIQAFREVVETWEGYEEFLPKLDDLIKNIGEIGKKCYTPNKRGCGFNVLNHGDLHLRNILVKTNNENRINRLYLVSFKFVTMNHIIIYLSCLGRFSTQRVVLSRRRPNLCDGTL